jgi:hypothetical protein
LTGTPLERPGRPTGPSTPRGYTPAGRSSPLSGQDSGDTHRLAAAEGSPPGVPDPFRAAVEAQTALLGLLAANVDDLEGVRIALQNRIRQATQTTVDADGHMRGLGLDERNPYVADLTAVLQQAQDVEAAAVRSLRRAMRRHPLGPWVKAQRGLGEKQVARLLHAIGDPYWRPELVTVTNEQVLIDPARPRRVSELWAYCGLHVLPARQALVDAHKRNAGGNQTGHPDQLRADAHRPFVGVAPKRQRGQPVNWSTTAKTRVCLIAESAMKQLAKPCVVDPEAKAALHVDGCRCSPFRVVYDDGRRKYASSVHKIPCPRCGPAGSPAPVGSPLSDGHKHSRALRLVAKAVLKEMWLESRRLHGVVGDEDGLGAYRPIDP